MEQALKMLSMAAGILITCGLISFAVLTYNESRRLEGELLSSISDLNTEYAEYEWTRYDGVCVSGSEVIMAIGKYQGDLAVTVRNGDTVTTYTGGFKGEKNVPGRGEYIALSSNYMGEVIRDAKDRIIGLGFKKI